jgi:hypothetical protein
MTKIDGFLSIVYVIISIMCTRNITSHIRSILFFNSLYLYYISLKLLVLGISFSCLLLSLVLYFIFRLSPNSCGYFYSLCLTSWPHILSSLIFAPFCNISHPLCIVYLLLYDCVAEPLIISSILSHIHIHIHIHTYFDSNTITLLYSLIPNKLLPIYGQ